MILRLIIGILMGLIFTVFAILYIGLFVLPFSVYEAMIDKNFIDAHFGSGGVWKSTN